MKEPMSSIIIILVNTVVMSLSIAFWFYIMGLEIVDVKREAEAPNMPWCYEVTGKIKDDDYCIQSMPYKEYREWYRFKILGSAEK